MKVNWQIKKGWPNALASALTRQISQLVRADRGWSRFKIGITNDPARRANQYGDEYEEMIVIYETSSASNVDSAERYLIDYYYGVADGLRAGGGGPKGDPPYYLYVVRG